MGELLLESPVDQVDLDVRRVLVGCEDVCDFFQGVLVDLFDELVLLKHTVNAVNSAVAVLLAFNEEAIVSIFARLRLPEDSKAIGTAGLDLAAVNLLIFPDDAVAVELFIIDLAGDNVFGLFLQVVMTAKAKALAFGPLSFVELHGIGVTHLANTMFHAALHLAEIEIARRAELLGDILLTEEAIFPATFIDVSEVVDEFSEGGDQVVATGNPAVQ